jgi:hypothetical protein
MIGGYIVIALMVVSCALLVIGTRWLETRYYRNHPPDNWDGTREDKDEHGGTG